MRDGFISMGHGRALVNVDKKQDQIAIYQKIIANNLSVRDTEYAVKVYHHPEELKRGSNKAATTIPAYIESGIEELNTYLSAKTNISVDKNGKGKIAIPFKSEAEFHRLKKLISGE